MHWIYRREGMGYGKKVDYPSCCSYRPVTMDDPFKWEAAIFGPYDTPYEHGVFFLSIDLHPQHPTKPPTIKFLTKVFHPNIDEGGKIYVDILEEEKWRPVHTIESLLLSICSLLAEPDPVDPTFESCHLYRYGYMSMTRIRFCPGPNGYGWESEVKTLCTFLPGLQAK
ncbi:hypothetical protein FNV43_RR02343 [Rhamnella rubrinervis]|uniref:UBC core domain-containing protein n=1 Tax=Rhamnella rubrinervis TaxID=2594499 RepID=A0A8K0MTZ2_9ROSA|nr:hypothetical protein FNV43_RR02343 [Rhamnella rubrinervis]